jgi:hypothetical protein
MSPITEAMAQEVHDLNNKVLELVSNASTPEAALNTLLTAYINLAGHLGVLEQVPGAGIALGDAARTLMALRTPSAAPQASPIH